MSGATILAAVAVMDDAAQVLGRDGYSAIPNDLIAARNAVAELIEKAQRLEVAANTVAYCYGKRPENFAVALSEMRADAEEVRAALLRCKGVQP